MLRLSLLFLVGVGAHDDQSLMQHQVGVESTVALFRSAVQEVSDALSMLPNNGNGKMRQMAIDALMQTVSRSEKLDDTANKTLGEIITMLKGVLGGMEADATRDGDAYALVLAETLNCTLLGNDSMVDAYNDVTFSGNAHATCRIQEDALRTTRGQECQNINGYLGSDGFTNVQDPPEKIFDHCEVIDTPGVFDSYTPAQLNQWFANQIQSQQNLLDLITGEETDCVQADLNWRSKTSECHDLQHTYESDLCTLQSESNGFCSDQTQCWIRTNASHIQTMNTTKHNADIRVNEARAIEYVICLIRALRAGRMASETPADVASGCKTSIETLDFEKSLQDAYNITYGPRPNYAECIQLTDSMIFPGSTNFIKYKQSEAQLRDPPFTYPDHSALCAETATSDRNCACLST